jgi:hypothetical protein
MGRPRSVDKIPMLGGQIPEGVDLDDREPCGSRR